MRLKLDGPCILRDKDGNEVAKLLALTLEVSTGGRGAGVDVEIAFDGAVDEGTQTTMVARDTTSKPKFDAPREVWAEYVRVMSPRDAGLHEQERKLIRDALKVATIEECKSAIRGCAASDFHMKRGPRTGSRKFNRLSDILKGKRGGKTTREQIDMFLEIAEKAGVKSGVTSVDPGRLSRAKRDVLDATEFPGDPRIVEKADEARQWLQEHGIKVEQDGSRTTFVLPEETA